MAKCFCPKHGRLDLDDVEIKDGVPICRKCRSVLEFAKVRPRYVEKPTKKRKRRRRKRSTKKR